jgi:hypothetical protein
MDGGPHVDVLVVSATSKGKDQTIARTLASKPRASEEITLPGGTCLAEKKVAPLPLFHGPTPLGVSDPGYNIVAVTGLGQTPSRATRGSKVEQA